MSVPGLGWSVSDLISAVDWTIKFVIALNSVRGEVKELKESLEWAKGELEGLEDILQKRRNRLEGPMQWRIANLQALRSSLRGILNDIFSLLNRFDPQGASRFSAFRQNVRWVVDSRYSGTVKDLRRRLFEHTQRIHTELLFWLNYNEASKEPSRPSSSIDPVPSKPAAHLSAFDKETRSSSSSISVAPTATSRPVVASKPTPLPLTSQNQSPLWQRGNPPPSPPPSPDLGSSGSSQTGSIRNTNSIARQAPPVQIARAPTLPPYTSSQLVPERLQTNGDVKVWFQFEDPKDPNDIVSRPYAIKTINILRDRLGNFRGIHSTRFDNAVLEHHLPNDKFFLKFFSHPFPVHSRQVRDLKEGQVQARNCISFLRERRDPATMIPDYYSFSSREDYRSFQSKIVGSRLLLWVEVRSISSKWSPTPLCESQILQLWEVDGAKQIHFFRNGKDRQYSQHCVSSLRDAKKTLEDAQRKGLKLIFERSNRSPALSPEELRMEYLIIVFSNPDEIELFLTRAGFP